MAGAGGKLRLFSIPSCVPGKPIVELAVEAFVNKQTGKTFSNLKRGWATEMVLALEVPLLAAKVLEYPIAELDEDSILFLGYRHPQGGGHEDGGHHSEPAPHPKKPTPPHGGPKGPRHH